MSFEVTVVEFPAKHLIGMKVQTDMQKAQTDCPAVWQTFGPRIVEIPGCDCACIGAYGVSICSMLNNENDFDYWAAVEASPDTAVPAGMQTMNIPAGLYAKSVVASLEKLGEVYTYIYGEWIARHPEFALTMQAPGFELYPPNWRLNDAFEIYIPVTKK